MWHKWKIVSVRLKIVLILTQYSCTVCADRTIDSEITPMELLGDVGQVESHFCQFGDSVSVGAR
jgi:hypothetical protein